MPLIVLDKLLRFESSLLVFVAGAMMLGHAASVAGQDARSTSNWAVIAADESDAAIADLMTAKLSKLEGIQLVERSVIARLLDELKLGASGLVDPNSAAQFGKLASADAILIVESVNQGKSIRTRLIETRTGVLLADELASPGTRDQQSAEVSRRLNSVRQNLRVEDTRRKYLGVVGIRSEEPGRGLDSVARTLSVLLEHDLRRIPGVVVLERNQLARLTAESDLTGLELSLRASALLVEGGLRRDTENDKWSLALRLLPLGGGKAKSLDVASKPAIPDARRELQAAIAESLNAKPTREPALSPTELKAEALLLATRAAWLVSHSRHLDAAPLAEAALTLDPSPHLHFKTMFIHYNLSMNAGRSKLERLQSALRGNQIDQQFQNQMMRKPGGVKNCQLGLAFLCGVKLRDLNPEEKRILEETQQLQREKFEWLLAERRGQSLTVAGLLIRRLNASIYLADSPEQFAADVRRLVEELDHETASGHFSRSLSIPSYGAFFSDFRRILGIACRIRKDNPRSSAGPPLNWGPNRIAPLLQWLTRHKDPRMQMLGWYGISTQAGESGLQAARKVVDLWLNRLSADDALGANYLDSTIQHAASRLHDAGELETWFESILVRAEKVKDATDFVRWYSPMRQCLFNVDMSKSVPWSERIIALLNENAYDESLRVAAEEMKAQLANSVDRRLHRGRYARPTDEGWNNFNLQELVINGRGDDWDKFTHAAIDRSEDSKDPIIMVWRSEPRIKSVGITSGDVIVTRLPRLGGWLSEVGRFETADFLIRCIAVSSSGDVALGSHKSGVAIVSPSGVKQFTASNGLPEAHVEAAAWLDGRLFLAFPGAIGVLDSATGQFRLLVSSKAVQSDSILDGGSIYEVKSLMADAEGKCVWASLSERADQSRRNGIWRIEPDGRMRRVFAGRSGHLSWTDDGLFFLQSVRINRPLSWNVLETQTEKTRTLSGFSLIGSLNVPQRPGWAYLGGHIVINDGNVFTPPGKRFHHKSGTWQQVIGRLDKGLVCAKFGSPRLWYVEPRNLK